MDILINKEEYKLFCQKIDALLQKYSPEKERENIYYINTPCGKLRVSISDYNRHHQWIFTKIEHPEKVMQAIRERNNFNNFSGKHNNVGKDLYYLLAWLYCYIEDLTNPQKNGKLREPLVELTYDREGKFSLWK